MTLVLTHIDGSQMGAVHIDPAVAYYCKAYAAQLGIGALKSGDDEGTRFLPKAARCLAAFGVDCCLSQDGVIDAPPRNFFLKCVNFIFVALFV